MPTLTFAVSLCPGQEEAYRRLAQELAGSQRPDYEAARRRLGLWHETLWLAHTRAGELAVVRLAADEPGAALTRQAAAEGPFDRWLREQWLALTGCEPARAARQGRLDRLFEWKAAERSAAAQNHIRSVIVEEKETIK